MRVMIAFSIIAGVIVVGVPMLLVFARRRRATKLRRRGVKSYNRQQRTDPLSIRSNGQ
ncbi:MULTISPECIES: hypothetical protein [Sphingomonas]|nr:hypothetical protein [Sphingomonas faeni]